MDILSRRMTAPGWDSSHRADEGRVGRSDVKTFPGRSVQNRTDRCDISLALSAETDGGESQGCQQCLGSCLQMEVWDTQRWLPSSRKPLEHEDSLATMLPTPRKQECSAVSSEEPHLRTASSGLKHVEDVGGASFLLPCMGYEFAHVVAKKYRKAGYQVLPVC